jgi:hypothetical protein
MSQTTGSNKGTHTSTSGSSQRTNNPSFTSAQGRPGQRNSSDVTAAFQSSAKPTQGQPNHQQGQWEKKAGNNNSQQTSHRGKDDGKNASYTGGKK